MDVVPRELQQLVSIQGPWCPANPRPPSNANLKAILDRSSGAVMSLHCDDIKPLLLPLRAVSLSPCWGAIVSPGLTPASMGSGWCVKAIRGDLVCADRALKSNFPAGFFRDPGEDNPARNQTSTTAATAGHSTHQSNTVLQWLRRSTHSAHISALYMTCLMIS